MIRRLNDCPDAGGIGRIGYHAIDLERCSDYEPGCTWHGRNGLRICTAANVDRCFRRMCAKGRDSDWIGSSASCRTGQDQRRRKCALSGVVGLFGD